VSPVDFFAELKRRNVYKVAVAYAVVAWLLIQIATQVFPFFKIPDWTVQLIVLLLILGFPVVMILAWAFELTPEGIKREAEVDRRITRKTGRKLTALVVVFAAIAAGLMVFRIVRSERRAETANQSVFSLQKIEGKSIAVLPFENLSDEKQNAYLAVGLVDEILTDLTKVADLKVICRTSVMQYASGEGQDVRKIAAALGVAHILMGSVQRVGSHLRVHAQLVDGATAAQTWAESYDRAVTDIFAVESDLAQAMVAQLHARLSPAEKAEIASDPTSDLEAFELYTRAREFHASSVVAQGEEKRLQAIALLEEATKRDPQFLRAYCTLVRIHSEIYLLGMDHTEARLRLAQAALQSAIRLQPEAGEAHLAAAFLRYCQLDYDAACRELAAAQLALPNESFVFELKGYIDRRQGRWQESERNLLRALDLDPRNLYFLQQLSLSYEKQRRFDEVRLLMDRALAIAPNDSGIRTNRAEIDLFARADTKAARSALAVLVRDDPPARRDLAVELIQLALYERDFDAADRALAGMEEKGGLEGAFAFPRSWYAGLIARAKGNAAVARDAFTKAHAEVAKDLSEEGEFPQPLSILGMIDAALGNKQTAVTEGRRASQLLPLTQDAITGADILQHLAVTFAWCGDKDSALEQLSILSKIPSDVNYGILRLDPVWDSLRGDPRFDEILASLAPKEQKR
jgi:TolB-like protein/Tfp pilus assembly protein PilF